MGENTEQTTNRKTETTAQMNELNKALLELKKITGISLEVSGAAPEQIEPALTQIHCLCTAYKEKYNRTDFLQGLMTGNIPHYEISDRQRCRYIRKCCNKYCISAFYDVYSDCIDVWYRWCIQLQPAYGSR